MKNRDVYIFMVIGLSIVILMMGMVMNGLIIFSHRTFAAGFGLNATTLTLIGLLGVNTGCALKAIARQLE